MTKNSQSKQMMKRMRMSQSLRLMSKVLWETDSFTLTATVTITVE